MKFTNTHMHVFTDKCVPVNFLKIIPSKMVRRWAPQIMSGLRSEAGRFVINKLALRTIGKEDLTRKKFDKYIAFLNVALQRTQREVLQVELETLLKEDPGARAVVLTMNMDFMDNVKPPMDFETQLADVMQMQRYLGVHMICFLGIDPRHKTNGELVEWCKPYFENGLQLPNAVKPFFNGIKLYPSLGFFPFDKGLDALYAYAQTNGIPVMSHCTRVGSQYIGTNIEQLIPKDLSLIYKNPQPGVVANTLQTIQSTIEWYYGKGWIANNKNGANDKACDLFTHPINYKPVLEKFPNLKICLAHMGGSSELIKGEQDAYISQVRTQDPILWGEHIIILMCEYPNLYTDISYTLNELDKDEVFNAITKLFITRDKFDQPLYKRVLFGTDFFMTEQEKREQDLFALAKEKLSPYWEYITRINPTRFIGL